MGLCISQGDQTAVRAHREAEKVLKETKTKMDSQVKILLLGSGDSGKSTVLKQMRVIHKIHFTSSEIESYRQTVFNNLVYGIRLVLEAMSLFEMDLDEKNLVHVDLVEKQFTLPDGEPFPIEYYHALKGLWEDPQLQQAYERGNEVALPENLTYFFSHLSRLFKPGYKPTDQDILHCRARTTGISETVFRLRTHELHLVDVGGQKSERRKWVHQFEGVTSILFLASLNAFDMSLSEDRDANQMQDAMAIWDSICHSQWFKTTSIILFLNKLDLFTEKIKHSDIKNVFPDYEGEAKNVEQGKEYFRKRFLRLAQKSSRIKEREIYVHYTNATDTALLRVVMAAVEDIILRGNLGIASLI